MAVNEVVSGMGANSSRTDKNVSERVAKIQREAKIQNMSGGSYGERADVNTGSSSIRGCNIWSWRRTRSTAYTS